MYICINIINYNEYFNNKNDKINGIDKIIWINLDRSMDRRNKMIKLLGDINIDNRRIKAIDGKEQDLMAIINNISYKPNITNREIACCLSHIKAINSLKYEKGEYFMICEDDISFDNLKYFKKNDLKKIINNAPNFDILMLHKTYPKELKNIYTKWYAKYNIYSAVCYIISKKGVEKLINYVNYQNNQFIFNKKDDYFEESDHYLYKKLNTWVYKFNFITSLEENSTIHNEKLKSHIRKNNINNNIIKKYRKYL